MVIIIHGFKAWKNWGFYPFLANELALSGANVLKFNFSLNGFDDNEDIMSFPEKFASNTISREIEDIEFVIDSFTSGTIIEKNILDTVWNGEIYLLGHSLGGAIAMLVSDKFDYIKKIAMWASISRFGRYTLRQKREWRKKGTINFLDNRTGKELWINISYLDDVESNNYDKKLLNSINKFNKPLLIIHGSEDVTVPLKEAYELKNAADINFTTMKIIYQTGHTFGIQHPFTDVTPAFTEVISITKSFLGLI